VSASRDRDTLERLYRLAPRGAELGLDRMRAASLRFGRPERSFEACHVAGTNGKGSVCAMTAAMASSAGRRVGLYTSPHLCQFAERIVVGGRPVDERVLLACLDRVLTDAPELTFFEAATLTAFLVFQALDVELAVVEVGLGGRLDATNVLPSPRATAITRIALDHTDRLGDTLALIAREKAGIIKPRVPLVVGPLAPEAMSEVLAIARANDAPVTFATADVDAKRIVERSPPALAGAHQIENAAVAVALARHAGVSESAIRSGLESVRWPGRLEFIDTADGPVLLDAAHNPDGIGALAAFVRSRAPLPSNVALVFGVMADKDYRGMLSLLAPLADHRVYVAPEGRKAADPAWLATLAPGMVEKSEKAALDLARSQVGNHGLVVVAGSIFLVGAVRARLLGLPRDPPVAL
jgi:dihydrofolate synthase / folylpolyglutamate synthase